jgi:aminoglycoside phosphotransferase
MSVSQIQQLVLQHFTTHAAQWRLRAESVTAVYTPSPGGFGTMNFAVGDGRLAYHVKLRSQRDRLAAWARASSRLTERYSAPRLFAEIEIGGCHGLVFERLPGENPAHSAPDFVLEEIVPLLGALHSDRRLAALLGGGGQPARQSFTEYYLHMLDGDLDVIEQAAPLPFVDASAIAWMRLETDDLRERASRLAAFDETVDNAIHGDLWFGNILVDAARWFIIDWDDLKIGDPAHDLALILFTANDPRACAGPRNAAFAERFALYVRAALLTVVVDPLADWIEAEQFPNVCDSARAHREGLHRWALGLYRERYGRPVLG